MLRARLCQHTTPGSTNSHSAWPVAGGHPWPWPGGHHWNLTYGKRDDGSFMLDFRDDFYRRAAPHAVCRPTGEIWLDKLNWLAGGESATM